MIMDSSASCWFVRTMWSGRAATATRAGPCPGASRRSARSLARRIPSRGRGRKRNGAEGQSVLTKRKPVVTKRRPGKELVRNADRTYLAWAE